MYVQSLAKKQARCYNNGEPSILTARLGALGTLMYRDPCYGER